jgi:hypothetical protein
MSILLNLATATAQLGTSQKYNDAGSLNKSGMKTWHVSGTFGGATVVVQVSPDPLAIADASSRWETVGTFTAPGYITTSDIWKKTRANVSIAGTGTVEVEIL